MARLVFPHKKGLCESTSNETNRSRKCIIPETSRKSSWQFPNSHLGGGWLVMLCDDDDDDDGVSSELNGAYSSSISRELGVCFLWNPVSLENIQLPTLFQWITNKSSDLEQKYIFSRCVLSSPSPGNLDDSVSMVFFLFRPNGDDEFATSNSTSSRSTFVSFLCDQERKRVSNNCDSYLLVFCRPGDKDWRTQKLPVERCCIQSLICINGNELYVMCYNDRHIKIEFFDETLTIKPFNLNYYNYFPSVGGLGSDYLSQHVKSRNEIFRVIRHYYPGRVHDKVFEIHVYRMDFSLMVWKEVRSLDDHVLFLGKNPTTSSCSAAELGLTRGCVYYTMPKDKNLYKFDLEDNSILVSLPCSNVPTPWVSSADWITIPTSLCVPDARTRTEDRLVNDTEEDSNVVQAMENKSSVKDYEKGDQEQKKNGGELKVVVTLDILNEDILKLIASYFHPVDYIHFRAVCKSNRLAIPAMNWRTSSIETTSLSPWLVFCKKDCPIYKFVNPMHNNEKYLMNLFELRLLGATIRFSKGGWLLMSKGKKTVFFFNPFTKRKIKLPDLLDEEVYIFTSMSFSSSPTSSDCVVFVIGTWSCRTVVIYFIGRGQDSWSGREFRNTKLPPKGKCMQFKTCLNNPVFFDGAFYCLDLNGILGIFRFKGVFTWKLLANPKRPCTSFTQCFLVECDGNLLSVFLGNLGEQVQIFRLDSCKKNWVKVESLGKHMLFISDTSCLSAIASDSRMENNIYFSRFHGERILFYSLNTSRYHTLGSQHSAENFYNTKEQLSCSWIEPNWSSNTDKELEWLEI